MLSTSTSTSHRMLSRELVRAFGGILRSGADSDWSLPQVHR